MGSQRGQAIVLIALMLTIVIGMAAIAIDGSRAYALRRDMQAAVDASSLAAGDKLQQTGSWTSAEQAAANIFASNLRLYVAPACGSWGSPGATPFTVSCSYADGTVLTEVAQTIGPQGSMFTVSAQRNLQLQFGRILTNGTSPTIAATASGNVNNQRYTPAFGALSSAGCGGGSNAITVNGAGTLSVTGDIVSNGAISMTSGSVRVAGDIYARCQSPVPGAVTNACYPSGASAPCGYPDVGGATRSGFYLADPKFPPPAVTGGSRGTPNANVVLQPGLYAAQPSLGGGHCWFLSGGVYDFASGLLNFGDLVSNELKPPDEPTSSNNFVRGTQFWDSDGAQCSGGFQVQKILGSTDLPIGIWSIEVTSVRTDTYNGVSYQRESAPSMCRQVNLNNHFDDVQVSVSNVPGATSYNIYASLPGSGCAGPFGLAANLPVSGTVQNTNTSPCPLYTGSGCSLGNETMNLEAQLEPPFTPNASNAPPDSETAPIAFGLPNQNPPTGPGSRGDRANENNCETIGGAYTSCPAVITPGAVELDFPAGGCFNNFNGDIYVFSGYQYNWVSLYEPGPANPPSNGCTNTFGAATNSAYIGLIYTPSARASITSSVAFEAPGAGGIIADSFIFTGALPRLAFNAAYAPVPPATRITG
ncbi:MAG TPA: pilus assembly protein TadG-related protein [Candidatus Dormibacteraeota bacterium]|nr:pilus assembly protein TadG-related protein [Candidatus Dormibacteraeota bacterium]